MIILTDLAFRKSPLAKYGELCLDYPYSKKNNGGRISITGFLNGKEGETKNVSVALKRKIGDQYVNYEKPRHHQSSPILCWE